MKSEIAYIDDSKLNLDCIKAIFERDFQVQLFQKPDTFLSKFPKSSYACILLDIHMPIMDGFTLYEKVIEHPNYNGCPILFISSDDSDASRIRSFALGAVDFIGRDTNPDELIARVKSKILFFQKHRSIIEFGTLRINLTLLKTYLNNKELPLTFIELKILFHLLKNYPDAVSKENLVEHVWRTSHVLDATIYTHISNLNGKLEGWDHEVQTVKNKGVQLVKKEK